MKIFFIWLMIFCFKTHAFDFSFHESFEFGVANAPAHVEDGLGDIWSDFVREGKVRAYLNSPIPERRLEFWSKPEVEIELAKNLGVQTFRLGIDWQRILVNKTALDQYEKILKQIKAKGMKVMLTLFHHSEPRMTMEQGGWKNVKQIESFDKFSKQVFDQLNPYVDYWITFNEPNVYILFTRVLGNWPPGQKSAIGMLNLFSYKGPFFQALDNMAQAHKNFYNYAHSKNKNAKISIAHNVANYRSGGVLGEQVSKWLWNVMNFYFPDQIKDYMDFMGINYYGAEYVSVSGLHFSPDAEYNDAGRAFDPSGFYKAIKLFYERYQKPIYITENGTADADDIFRPLYLVEHLKVIHAALDDTIPVMGYIHWTLTDNFEWSDGYCPKFGLVAVDRKNDLKREPRASYDLYKQIIAQHKVTQKQQDSAFELYKSHKDKPRKMCRAINAKDGLDEPREIPLRYIDWRFKN